MIQALAEHGDTDQTAPVARHEVDALGRDLLGRDGQIALILAILVIRHDDELPGGNILDGFLDGRKAHLGLRKRKGLAHFFSSKMAQVAPLQEYHKPGRPER